MGAKFLALVGPPGAGKSTIGDAWLQRDPTAYHFRISFAEELRWEVATAFAKGPEVADILREMRDPELKGRWRGLLQTWGTARRERYGADYFLRPVEDRIRIWYRDFPHIRVVIDDCRYPNEYELLRRLGFVFVRLEPNPDAPVGLITAEQQLHESEQHWATFEVDATLSFEPGPEYQARRLDELNLWEEA